MKIDGINKMFLEKRVMSEAMKALVEKQEAEIKSEVEVLFLPLKELIKKTSFFLVLYAHYDYMKSSIIKNLDKENEVVIYIRDFKIYDVTGEKDEETLEVIEMFEGDFCGLNET